jgi:hypothetical protein
MMRRFILLGIATGMLGMAGVQAAEPETAPAAAESGIVLLSPKDYQVFQRQTLMEGTMRISGRCTVDFDGMEIRFSGKNLRGVNAPAAWTPIPVDPATGGFNTTVAATAGGWYKVEIRAVRKRAVVAQQTVEHVGVGEVFVGAGQSNSTNCGGNGSKSPLDGRTQPQSGMVSTFSGTEWRLADDPQPGTHDKHANGSFWPSFGDAMTEKYKVPVGVAVTGHGGTSINQWKKDGELFNWTLTRIRQLGPGGFRAVLWHQGESDAEMPAQAYADGLGQIIRDFKEAAGWEFPWFVAHASFRPGKPTLNTGSRGGQSLLWDKKIAVEGPDTDAMTGDLRDNGGKGIHFSKKGLDVHGKAWAEKVGAWLDTVLGTTGIKTKKTETDQW